MKRRTKNDNGILIKRAKDEEESCKEGQRMREVMKREPRIKGMKISFNWIWGGGRRAFA